MGRTSKEISRAVLAELDQVLVGIENEAVDAFVNSIATARRIAIYGAGREGLAIKGFAMRLFHVGLDVHVVGDMTTPPIGPGDLLIITSGTGELATAATLLEIASAAGARTTIVTAQPGGKTALRADTRVVIPAQTMVDDRSGQVSVLPMGSLFEFAEAIFFEVAILKLRDHVGESAETMRARHTNLE